MDLELRDKVVLVTAASRGIGLAVAHRFAAERAIVAISSRTPDTLDNVAKDLVDRGGTTSVHPVDLADPVATDALVPEVLADHGRLDVLVVNTPGPRITPFLDATTHDFAAAYDLLLRPAVQLAHAAACQMVEQRSGSIVFLTSTWVKQPASGGVLSATMRAGVSALAKTMALELAPYGIRVNQVMPGATGTDRMTQIVAHKAATNNTTPEQETARVVADIPLGRWASPEEIADTVAFIASPRAGFTTGTSIQVDGGAVRTSL